MDTPRDRSFTVLDWIGLLVTAAVVGWLLQWPFVTGPAMARMFEDMGGALPAITVLALSRPPVLAVAVIGAILALAAALWRGPLPARRLLGVAAFVVAGGTCALLVYAIYAPILGMAAAIK